MFNEDQLNLLPERICSRLERVNQHWLEIMGQRIKEIGTISATDRHRLERMKDIGGDVEKITAELMRISGRNAQEIYDIYDLVAADNVKFSEQYLGSRYIPYEDNTKVQQYVNALSKQAVYDYANFSHNTAMMAFKNGKKVATSLHDVYTSVIDDAITAVTSGQTDFYSAMRSSLMQLADSGLRTKYTPLKGTAGKTVDYATNYSRRLDTAVRQNLLWGIKQCNLGIQEQIGKSYGADGWEIDYHSNPRPSHAAMGGRQYHNGPGITIDGVYYPPFSDIVDLLEDYGCLHFKWPIILGISEPSHGPEELAKLKELDKAVIDFEGEEYTRYEMSQIQRKLETKIRHAKDRQIIAKAAGDDELRRREQAKINLLTSKYAQVSKAAGLPTRVERMRISGYHKVKTMEELDPNLTFIQNQAKIKAASSLPKKLKGLPDEKIKATVDVEFEFLHGVVPKGANATNVYVMAGGGTSTAIKDLKRLYVQYPQAGKPENWQKKSAEVLTNSYKYVVHWYENNGIVPADEIKTKGAKSR